MKEKGFQILKKIHHENAINLKEIVMSTRVFICPLYVCPLIPGLVEVRGTRLSARSSGSRNVEKSANEMSKKNEKCCTEYDQWSSMSSMKNRLLLQQHKINQNW